MSAGPVPDGVYGVVTYDGATDCDAAGTARWSLNGTDQGEIEGINCSVSAHSGRGAGTSAFAFALALALALGSVLRRRA